MSPVRPVSAFFRAAEGVGIALDSIRANKVRAALTILGVAIGVTVVIATHDENFATRLKPRAIALKNGELARAVVEAAA